MMSVVRQTATANVVPTCATKKVRSRMSTQSEVLNSWKEISNYIGRGIRTVQRWEKDFGLPVRRPSGHLKGSVFALRHEIDEWVTKCGARDGNPTSARVTTGAAAPGEHLKLDRSKFHVLLLRAESLMEKCMTLQAGARSLEDTLRQTVALREKLRELREFSS